MLCGKKMRKEKKEANKRESFKHHERWIRQLGHNPMALLSIRFYNLEILLYCLPTGPQVYQPRF